MREILATTDAVLISFVEALLREAGIGHHIADINTSAVEGSIGIFPRRVLVESDRADEALALLDDAGLGHELRGATRPGGSWIAGRPVWGTG